MIRVSETKDRFDARAERLAALLRDAGVSSDGPRMARPSLLKERFPRQRANLVIDWLRAKSQPLHEYLAYLVRFDLCLHRSLGKLYRDGDSTLRLALALLIDFAHAVGLTACELATLLHDAQGELLEAMEFLLDQGSPRESHLATDRDDQREAWGDAAFVPR